MGNEYGEFLMKVTAASADDADDPCNGGVTFENMPGATISFVSPDAAGMMCDWIVMCDPGQVVSVHFDAFSTETNVDTVNLYDGDNEDAHKIRGGNLSGDLVDLPTRDFTSTGPAMFIGFTSDASEGDSGDHGFVASYSCTVLVVMGCMDPSATNYDATATSSDGSCSYPPPPPAAILGCMDPNAENYNQAATGSDGSCSYPPPPPVAPVPPPPPDVLRTDGTFRDAVVYNQGDEVVFQFTARAGQTYLLETEQCDEADCLSDTVMQLIGVDGTTVLVENDDDARVTGLLESYIEWTCPSDGVYYVLVKAYSLETGRFQVRATEANAGNGGDPCVEGTRLGLLPGAELTSTDPNDWIEAAIISFKPDGNYQDDAICVWQIQCQPDQVVSLTFLDFNTEEGYDWVSLNGGDIPRDNYVLSQMLNQGGIGMPPTDNALIMTHSGRFADMAETHFTSIDEEEVDDPSALTLSFESDASIGGEGFEASYACQTPTEVEQVQY